MFQYSQIVYIKSITEKKLFLFLSFYLLTYKNDAVLFEDAVLLVLILHLSFFKCFGLFKFNVPSQKSDNMYNKKIVLIRLKVKAICLTKKAFLSSY